MTPEQKQAAWLATVRRVMKTADGKEFIHTLLERCAVFRQTYQPGEFDVTAYYEGKRSIGLQLLKEALEAAPESYLQMMMTMKERADERADGSE